MKLLKESQQGFTLVEVMVAITVFAIGVLAVASMQIAATGGNSMAVTTTDLTLTAAQQMEVLMATSFDQLVDTNADGEAGLSNTGPDPAAGGADYEIQNGDIILSWNIATGVPIERSTAVRVIATKLNADMDGVLRTVTLNAFNSIP